MSMGILFENSEGFSQILKEQSGKKGIWVVDYANTEFSIFVIEYLREYEKVRETVFKPPKNGQNLVTLSL